MLHFLKTKRVLADLMDTYFEVFLEISAVGKLFSKQCVHIPQLMHAPQGYIMRGQQLPFARD